MPKTRIVYSQSDLVKTLSSMLNEPTVFRASEIKTLAGSYGVHLTDHKLTDLLRSKNVRWITPREANITWGALEGGSATARHYAGSDVYDLIKEQVQKNSGILQEETPEQLKERLKDYIV